MVCFFPSVVVTTISPCSSRFTEAMTVPDILISESTATTVISSSPAFGAAPGKDTTCSWMRNSLSVFQTLLMVQDLSQKRSFTPMFSKVTRTRALLNQGTMATPDPKYLLSTFMTSRTSTSYPPAWMVLFALSGNTGSLFAGRGSGATFALQTKASSEGGSVLKMRNAEDLLSCQSISVSSFISLLVVC